MNDNIAVAHEHFPARGGGEVVADALADAFDAPIVTGWIDDEKHSRHDPIEILENTPVNPLRRFFGNPLVRDTFYMFAWETVPTLREYDTIIQSGNAPTWYVPNQEQTIVKYNHSPPRNPFDLFWREESHTAGPLDLFIPGYVADRVYKKAARHMWKSRTDEVDLWVCNSELIKHRTKKFLGVPEEKLEVVYPPVDVEQYEPTGDDDGYFLSFGRLVPSKRNAVLIDAFHKLNAAPGPNEFKLVIAGDGYERDELEERAGDADYIEFRGYVSEERKPELMQNAKALLFAADNEDFGMVPIEAMAAGTPVLGVNDGFTQFQIRDGENGRLFRQNAGSVAHVIKEFERDGVEWAAETIHRFAEQFGVERFEREMQEMVEKAEEMSAIEADIPAPDCVTEEKTEPEPEPEPGTGTVVE